MDRDRQQAREPQNSARDGGGAEGITHLPGEIMAEVAKRLPTDDPVETANNLTNFKLMGRSAREAVQTSAVGAFHARLNRLGTSAKALNSLDLPEADDRAHAFAPTIKFQSPARKSAIVDDILKLPDHAQAEEIASIARHLGDFDHVSRTRLVDRAIELFKQVDPVHHTHIDVTMALISGHDHLNADQKAQILDVIVDCPIRAERYTGLAAHVDHSPDATMETQSSHLDKSIDAIEGSVDELVAYRPLGSREEMLKIREVGKSIHEAYDRARAELTASSRSRERSNLAR